MKQARRYTINGKKPKKIKEISDKNYQIWKENKAKCEGDILTTEQYYIGKKL